MAVGCWLLAVGCWLLADCARLRLIVKKNIIKFNTFFVIVMTFSFSLFIFICLCSITKILIVYNKPILVKLIIRICKKMECIYKEAFRFSHTPTLTIKVLLTTIRFCDIKRHGIILQCTFIYFCGG